MGYTLSYIISTRNRLPFLKITLGRLLQEVLPDEEIVVVDGNSTDGTREYLQTLFEEGRIQQFISEPDRNQAHGWNKAMLLARGLIIKKIIDDDVFCYSAIRKCRDFMLKNPDVDVLISNEFGVRLQNPAEIEEHSRQPQFHKWRRGGSPVFTFGDVHMLIRRSSLAYIGLYNTGCVMIDWEYSLHISHLQAKIVYYTGYNALSVQHDQTVTALKDRKLIEAQANRAHVFYQYEGDMADVSLWSKFKIRAGKYLKRARPLPPVDKDQGLGIEMEVVYNRFYDYLNDKNQSGVFSFLTD